MCKEPTYEFISYNFQTHHLAWATHSDTWMKMMTMPCQGAVQVTVIHSLEKKFKSLGKTTSTAS